jgi:hypothetical protein
MNEETRAEGIPILRLKQLRCRRLARLVDLEEHESCPYCFGHRKELLTGRYETFCDWQPGRDPIQFGFPPGTRRELYG